MGVRLEGRTAVVSPALSLWSGSVLWAMRGVRAHGANRMTRPLRGASLFSACPCAGPTCSSHQLIRCSRGWEVAVISGPIRLGRVREGVEGPVVLPDGPGDPGELVGEGRGGLMWPRALSRARAQTPSLSGLRRLAARRTERAPWISNVRR